MKLRNLLCLLILLATGAAYAQKGSGADTAAVNAWNQESKGLIGTDSAKAIDLASQAKQLAIKLKYKRGEAVALKNIGMVYYMKGMYAETLDYWNQSLQDFEAIPDDLGVSNMLNNIGAIYLNQGADDKALEYILKSLQIAEKAGDTLRMITALSNVGGIYHNKKDPVALNYLLKAIPLAEGSGNVTEYVGITGNIGEIYADRGADSSALNWFKKSMKAAGTELSPSFALNGMAKVYGKEKRLAEALQLHNQALEMAKKFDDQLEVVRSLRGIADVYAQQQDPVKALENYEKARLMAEQMDDVKVELKDLYKDLAAAYAVNHDFTNAYRYKSLYSDIKDTLYTLDTKKKLNQLQFDFELSKKQGEIVLQEAKIKSEKQARIGVTLGLGLILVIAFIIYRNYLQKVKVNKLLDKQKDQIESLLLNILPKEVATELQVSGKSRPRHFDEVSVLFTDFKGFTAIADKLSPEEVVEELNECFMAFDGIMEKYGLEKIKTIGDAYMCAGNIPSPHEDHVYKMVRAAKEIQEFMKGQNEQRVANEQETWEIRIGIHVGPIVAGVVGRKKYAYDIWGSTVNVASRMESNGVPGEVNISAATYELVKDRFDCSHRGKIYAKNLGELDMYILGPEKTNPLVTITTNGDTTAHIQERLSSSPVIGN